MSRIELAAVRKAYGDVEVVHGLDLEIEDGEFVALVGPSGCGKSTILRMIAGLEDISGGTILFDGKPVNDADPKTRNIAMVFQNYALYPHMSVRENIGLNLRLSGRSRDEITRRVSEAADMLGLGDLLDRRPSQLSGGQRQRVAMGRAMVRNPAVFLFDEPLSNLDAKLRVQMRAEIKHFHQTMQRTSIYVTHDQIEAMTLADKVVVLDGGRIEQVGDPVALYETPSNVFVAQFIGSPAMNLVEGRAETDGRGARSLALDIGWTLPVAADVALAPGRKVLVGIRPEHLEPAADGYPARVSQTEIAGSQTAIEIEAGGRRLWSVVQGIDATPVGRERRFGFSPALAHVFDADTGARMGSLSEVAGMEETAFRKEGTA